MVSCVLNLIILIALVDCVAARGARYTSGFLSLCISEQESVMCPERRSSYVHYLEDYKIQFFNGHGSFCCGRGVRGTAICLRIVSLFFPGICSDKNSPDVWRRR